MNKVIEGIVSKKIDDKTLNVVVKRVVIHPIYKKHYFRTKNYLVHDESGNAVSGTKIKIVACRPISKRKRFKLLTP